MPSDLLTNLVITGMFAILFFNSGFIISRITKRCQAFPWEDFVPVFIYAWIWDWIKRRSMNAL